jgi:tRNA1Val (adenine37-N6)-methyltransferase
MGRNNYFKFKQFTIFQEKAAMKVGTDGVLLGAWAECENCNRILDVGTGTGLIALMLAQRSNAQITAIEIEENAAEDARQNIGNSPWKSRVVLEHVSFQEFTRNNNESFDLIVSNPPFFTNAFKPSNNNRAMARHSDSLPFSALTYCSAQLLGASGKLAVILPFEASIEFEELAAANNLFLSRKTKIRPNLKKEENRVLLEFSKKKVAIKKDNLTIYVESGHAYTDSFIELIKDFYLHY